MYKKTDDATAPQKCSQNIFIALHWWLTAFKDINVTLSMSAQERWNKQTKTQSTCQRNILQKCFLSFLVVLITLMYIQWLLSDHYCANSNIITSTDGSICTQDILASFCIMGEKYEMWYSFFMYDYSGSNPGVRVPLKGQQRSQGVITVFFHYGFVKFAC